MRHGLSNGEGIDMSFAIDETSAFTATATASPLESEDHLSHAGRKEQSIPRLEILDASR